MADSYDYDLFVIGGGSGGLAASKQAASHGVKVAVADFVKPSPAGTTWGLGGTCVNVGCIPKKLFHIAAGMRDGQADAHGLGWETKAAHSWEKMLSSVNNHIKSLNFNYKGELRDAKVKYYNSFATFVDAHTIQLDNGKGKVEKVTAKKILLAPGGRPNLGGYPGAEECCVTSDDIFWQKKPPGKTLVIGASYIALECAGFLAGLGFDTTVMVRSIFLRGFDQDFANRIADHMERHGVKFVKKMVPDSFEKTADGRVKVMAEGKEFGIYDTVLVAVGRTGCAALLNLEAAGVEYKNGKIKVNEQEQTNVEHIYGIGDILEGKLELTPTAIQAGKLLANRLFGGKTKLMDYENVATTVFTPLEYGTVGLSEEDAIKKLGEDNVVIYHAYTKPLEWTLNHDRDMMDVGYMKFLCDKTQGEKVVGVHILGPNCGEVLQGLAVAMQVGFTKENLDDCVGIHPTFAEGMTTITEKRVGPPKEGQARKDEAGALLGSC